MTCVQYMWGGIYRVVSVCCECWMQITFQQYYILCSLSVLEMVGWPLVYYIAIITEMLCNLNVHVVPVLAILVSTHDIRNSVVWLMADISLDLLVSSDRVSVWGDLRATGLRPVCPLYLRPQSRVSRTLLSLSLSFYYSIYLIEVHDWNCLKVLYIFYFHTCLWTTEWYIHTYIIGIPYSEMGKELVHFVHLSAEYAIRRSDFHTILCYESLLQPLYSCYFWCR